MFEWLYEWRYLKYRYRKKIRTVEDDFGFRYVEFEWFMRWIIRLVFCLNMKFFKGWKINLGDIKGKMIIEIMRWDCLEGCRG